MSSLPIATFPHSSSVSSIRSDVDRLSWLLQLLLPIYARGVGSIRLLVRIPDGDDSGQLRPFSVRADLQFWYGSGFGSPVARAQGIGYVQELVARLTKTPMQTVCCDCSHFLRLHLDLQHMLFFSTIRPLTRRWTTTRLRSPWTDVPCMSMPPMM